ncbi:MAG: Gfo/Idh/MocA family oxidoreductase [Acidobacteria bacterium]|nr:Gfo/Idh/MocA family oxidoreductase [Acidobacteriota bacterium]
MDQKKAPPSTNRRNFLATAATAGFTTNLFTGNLKGANDKVNVAFIGMGKMGTGNLSYAMKIPGFQPVAVCDVYQPHMEMAQAQARRGGVEVKAIKDFREIIADKSIDAVNISTPDHWHAYITIEACKAGKDVYVEKPACVYVDEGRLMVEAARKYKRVVQGGTMQRSGGYFKKAKEITQSGQLGEITFCHTWQAGLSKKEGWGKPADAEVPAGLDWDLWLGPAQKRPFNYNRFIGNPKNFSSFRYFWDYAGGAMTDWGVHLIDPMHQCLDEVMPKHIVALGSKFYVDDNVETPDTMLATFQYEKFLSSYESRTCNPMPMFEKHGAATAIHGTEATLIVNRSGCWVYPNKDSKVEPQVWEKNPEMSQMNVPHWENFLECIKTREKPTSDIENCVRSSATCILANVAMRSGVKLDWDEKEWTVAQKEARPYLKAKYRSPWKLEV